MSQKTSRHRPGPAPDQGAGGIAWRVADHGKQYRCRHHRDHPAAARGQDSSRLAGRPVISQMQSAAAGHSRCFPRCPGRPGERNWHPTARADLPGTTPCHVSFLCAFCAVLLVPGFWAQGRPKRKCCNSPPPTASSPGRSCRIFPTGTRTRNPAEAGGQFPHPRRRGSRHRRSQDPGPRLLPQRRRRGLDLADGGERPGRRARRHRGQTTVGRYRQGRQAFQSVFLRTCQRPRRLESVAYSEEGEYLLAFTLSARSKAAYEGNLPVFVALIQKYAKDIPW